MRFTGRLLARLLLALAAVALLAWAGSAESLLPFLTRGLVGLAVLFTAHAWALFDRLDAEGAPIMRGG